MERFNQSPKIYFRQQVHMAFHTQFNQLNKYRTACGLPLIPIKTKLEGPGSVGFQSSTNEDIIDEAFKFFRVNVLFKNFEIRCPGDKVLVYLLVLISHLFKSTEPLKEIGQVQKKLTEINNLPNPYPKDKGNFMSPLLQDGSGNQRQTYLQYIKQLKAETINRFLLKFYQQDGFPIEDYKFWSGLAKKRFMGLNFVSFF